MLLRRSTMSLTPTTSHEVSTSASLRSWRLSDRSSRPVATVPPSVVGQAADVTHVDDAVEVDPAGGAHRLDPTRAR